MSRKTGILAVVLGLLLPGIAAQAQQILAAGTHSPYKIARTLGGNFLLAESGTGAGDGRVTLLTGYGARYPLLAGLPSAQNAEGAFLGPTAVADARRTLYVVIGEGDVLGPSIAGRQVPNPDGLTSPIYSSVIRARFDPPPDAVREGFTLSADDIAALADGRTVGHRQRRGRARRAAAAGGFPRPGAGPLPGHPPVEPVRGGAGGAPHARGSRRAGVRQRSGGGGGALRAAPPGDRGGPPPRGALAPLRGRRGQQHRRRRRSGDRALAGGGAAPAARQPAVPRPRSADGRPGADRHLRPRRRHAPGVDLLGLPVRPGHGRRLRRRSGDRRGDAVPARPHLGHRRARGRRRHLRAGALDRLPRERARSGAALRRPGGDPGGGGRAADRWRRPRLGPGAAGCCW